MIRRIVTFAALAVAAAALPAVSGTLSGSWTANLSEERPGRLYLSIETGRRGQQGSEFDPSIFTGLSEAQIRSATRVPVAFELRREAGTVRFEGLFRDGRGAGEFTFEPDPGFRDRLRAVGVAFRPSHGDQDRELLNLALFDVSIDFIRSMQAIGYTVSLDQIVAFRIFDVNPAYVREMASVGFDGLSAEKLVETRIHGATPEYIRTMRKAGEDLTLDQYIESRIFQVTPEFAREMEDAGYHDVPREMLTQFRIHGVNAEFVHALADVGYTRVPAAKLCEMRIHGVTPEFIRRVEKAGYHHVPIDKLVQMRIFNVDPEMVRALDDGGR